MFRFARSFQRVLSSSPRPNVIGRRPVLKAATIMSLCFNEAYNAKAERRISEKEYFECLTAHLRGVRHDADDDIENYKSWGYNDHTDFTRSFREFALTSRTLSSAETAIYDQLLERCSAGDLEATRSLIAKLEDGQSLKVPLQALAAMASSRGYSDMLFFLLDKGANFDKRIDANAWSAVRDVKLMEFLWDRNSHNIHNHKNSRSGMFAMSVYRNLVPMLEFLIGKGCKPDTHFFEWFHQGDVSLPVMKVLIREYGVAQWKGSALLTLTIQKGNRETAHYLIKLGLPLSDVPPDLDPREGYYPSPLMQAVSAKDFDTFDLLLKHGADPYGPYSQYTKKPFMQYMKESGPKDFMDVLEKYTSGDPRRHKL